MELANFQQKSDDIWILKPMNHMRVPGIIYGSASLIANMDEKVATQLQNVASLPGIQIASYAMPDAHWGYGFPIGGVAAFDPDDGGVISAGGVGFDISCGVRLLISNLTKDMVEPAKSILADKLFSSIPAGLGRRGRAKRILNVIEMDTLLKEGAIWALQQGYGKLQDLRYTEEQGCISGALPEYVSFKAKKRQMDEVGTLGSGNHYIEVQYVAEIWDTEAAKRFGLIKNMITISVHCGSRGLGHQIGVEYLRTMALEASQYGITLPDRELACVPIKSTTGQQYLGAMKAAMNCAFANRQVLTHEIRQIFDGIFPSCQVDVLYDVSHNTCKLEQHFIDGIYKDLFVHRKGATCAFGPHHPRLPEKFQMTGQPVIVGGSMGTSSYLMVGTPLSESLAFSSSCHGAGRSMSRHEALRHFNGKEIVQNLAARGIEIRSMSFRGIAEEAPLAYKNIDEVVLSAERSGLSRRVATLRPLICIKG